MLSKKSKKNLRKQLEKKFLPKCFNSLDVLPVKIWWDLNETGNICLLLRPKINTYGYKEEYSLDDNEIAILNVLFIDLLNDYIKRYGFSDSYKAILNLKKQMATHYVNLIVREDNTEKVHINIIKQEIEELQNEMSLRKTDNLELKAYLDKELGFRIDTLTCPVTEYMSYIKMIEAKSAA